jgi:hypothetical protein
LILQTDCCDASEGQERFRVLFSAVREREDSQAGAEKPYSAHMMTSGTPPESAKPASELSNLHQEAVASLVLRESQRRDDLKRKAEGYAGYNFVPAALLIGLMIWRPYGWVLVWVALAAIFGLIQFHAWGINRRIDALMKLRAGNEGDK